MAWWRVKGAGELVSIKFVTFYALNGRRGELIRLIDVEIEEEKDRQLHRYMHELEGEY